MTTRTPAPAWLSALSAIGDPAWIRLDAAGLLEEARQRTGLHDFGGDGFREPLRVLLDSIENEAALHLVGRVLVRDEILGLLENRLRITEEYRRHPEIESAQVRRPIFVTGLPRSGTSILHELLACDPANRAPLAWEVRRPCPPPEPASGQDDPRIERAQRELDIWGEIVPEYATIHELGARLPVECILLTAHEFLSDQLTATNYALGYGAWLATADLRPAYAWHRRMLKLLGWRASQERWVLKAPSHMAALDALLDVYPDACIVQTHRDPLRIMGSVLSTLAATARVRSDRVDVERLRGWFSGEACLALLTGAERARKGVDARDARFCDVLYVDLMRDPIATIAGVYRSFGLTLGTEAAERMRGYLASKPKDKYGAHSYGLDYAGLDRESERRRFADYQSRYGVPSEEIATDRPSAGGSRASGNANAGTLPKLDGSAGADERLVSGAAWEQFCAALARTGKAVLAADAAATPADCADGFRYLTGLVNAGIRFSADFADPAVPRFFRSPDSRTQWGAENADNQYVIAGVRGDGVYRLTGERNSAFEFLVEVREGFMQLGDDRIFATVAASELEIADDGGFEILFSRERPAGHSGNWLPLDPEAKHIGIRQYFLNWECEIPATFAIERVGFEGAAPTPLTPAAMARILDEAGEWVETSLKVWNQWSERIRADHRPGLVAPAKKYAGGAEAIRYGNDAYRLEPGEALILETAVPQARYWAFQLCDLWFVGRDYANRQTSINNRQAHIDADGRFRCVVADEDPGVPNWLDAAGRTQGLLQYRWIWTTDNPQPVCRTVDLADLRTHLPADTPHVSPELRARSIAMRRRHIARREG